MKVTLTKDQLFQLAANAINASIPMGLGFLHVTDDVYTAKDIEGKTNLEDLEKYGLNFDYYEGRMVKLRITGSDGEYDIQPDNPQLDYQSWMNKYPTMQDLIDSVL